MNTDTILLPSGRIVYVFDRKLSIGPDLFPCYGSDGGIASGWDEVEQQPLPFPKEDREFLAKLAISYWTKFAEQP